jgi:hypothetical protein
MAQLVPAQRHRSKRMPNAASPLGLVRRRVAVAVLSIFGLLTLYLIATHSVPAGLSETEPGLALSLHADDPAAAVAYAQQAIIDEANRRRVEAAAKESAKQPEADLGSLKRLLRAAILKDPLNATAFRLLGQIALLENEAKTAHQMMAEAANLSIEETTAIDFMMRQSLLANNAKTALRYADILMRSDSSALGSVAPLVARMAEVPSAKRELIAKLGAAPPWRGRVLDSFAASGLTNPQAPLEVLVALKDTPHPPTETEVSAYINFLQQKKLYAFAYSAWLQFLPQDQLSQIAYLFNGSFERQPSGLPFDWTIGRSSETVAGVFARPDDANQSALFISFGQVRAAFPTIRETIVLRPGAYRFKGSVTGEMLARRGLQWRVTCLDGASAGESQMLLGRFPQWISFEFDISIPMEKCPAQTVELIHMARSPSEQLASGSIWFDDLAIVRRNAVGAPTP